MGRVALEDANIDFLMSCLAKTMNLVLSYPVLLLLELYPKEPVGDVGESFMAKNAHCSLIHNSRKVGNKRLTR